MPAYAYEDPLRDDEDKLYPPLKRYKRIVSEWQKEDTPTPPPQPPPPPQITQQHQQQQPSQLPQTKTENINNGNNHHATNHEGSGIHEGA